MLPAQLPRPPPAKDLPPESVITIEPERAEGHLVTAEADNRNGTGMSLDRRKIVQAFPATATRRLHEAVAHG
jgi:hypothetical protein